MSDHLDEAQRDLEHRALGNVRSLVDKLEDQDRNQDRLGRWALAALTIVIVTVVAIVGTFAYRPKPSAVAIPVATGRAPSATIATPSAPSLSCTAGVFEIVRMGTRTGQYKFGRKSSAGATFCELIDVDAGPAGDLKRAMIARMIESIRLAHRGNITWRSNRSGQVVTLSLEAQNNEQLEHFLLSEFFGPRNDSQP